MSSTLLFDLDNTLVDRDAAMGRFAGQWCVSDEVRAELLACDAGGQGCRESFAALLDRHVPGEAPWTPGSIAMTIASFVTPNAAVSAMLGRLEHTHQLGLVTNGGSASQRAKIGRAGLSEFFSVIYVSGESGYPKPAPQMFLSALGDLDCSPSDALFVGDSLRCDIEGAASVGMRTCWINPASSLGNSGSFPAADIIIPHVCDLETAMETEAAA